MYSQKEREEVHSIAGEIASYGMSTEGSLHKTYVRDRKASAARESGATDRILVVSFQEPPQRCTVA